MTRRFTGQCGNPNPHGYHQEPVPGYGGVGSYCYGVLESATYQPTDEQVERAARRLNPSAWDEAAIVASSQGFVTEQDPLRRARFNAQQDRAQARKQARTVLESLQLEEL